MKKITLIIALLGALNAHAGDYTEAASQLQLCEMVAMGSKMSYTETKRGHEVPPYPNNGYIKPLMDFARTYGMTAATADDAYSTTWGKCMDNLRKLTLDYKQNGTVYTELPY